MPARPTISTPGWVSSTNGSTEPSGAQKTAGFAVNEELTSGNLNWLLKSTSEWLTYAAGALLGDRVALDTAAGGGEVMQVYGAAAPWLLLQDVSRNATGDGLTNNGGSGTPILLLDLGTVNTGGQASSPARTVRQVKLGLDKGGGSSTLTYSIQYRDLESSGAWTDLGTPGTYTGTGTGVLVSTYAPDLAMNSGTAAGPVQYRLRISWTMFSGIPATTLTVYGAAIEYDMTAIYPA